MFITLLAVPIVVLGLLLSGFLPTTFGKEGVTWTKERADVIQALDEHEERLDKIQEAVERLRTNG